MDSKETKRILKEAKEAIKAKDVKTALQLCKTVLKSDKNNYVALVLFGAALQESDQHAEAPKAFKKACEVSPDQPLAWQGLVSYYEKHGKDLSSEAEIDLLTAYVTLVPLEMDLSKKQDMTRKLSDLAAKLQKPSECSLILSKLPNDQETAKTMQRFLVKALLKIKDLSENDVLKLGDALENLVIDWKMHPTGNDFDIQEIYRQYLKHLYRCGKHKKLVSEALSMSETFSKDPYPLEWVCKIWVEFLAEGKDVTFIESTISKCISTLETISTSLSAVHMASGAKHFYDGELLKAREKLIQAVNSQQGTWHVYLLLAETELKFGCPEEALSVLADAKTRIKKITKDQMDILMRSEAKALSATKQPSNLERAVDISSELLTSNKSDETLHLICAQAYVSLKCFDKAQAHITEVGSSGSVSVKVTLLQAQIMYLLGEKEKATSVLESIATDAKDAEVWLELAKLHEEEGKHAAVLTDLMEAARCEPNFWRTFMVLGNHYKQLSTTANLDKARRCYQKALHLNPKSLEVAELLSDVLLLLSDVDSNIRLLNMMSQSCNVKWVWLRLGLLHTECDEIDKAISFLCNAVRCDPLDCRVWESLGDAYMSRGSWHAALKSFLKVMQLSPSNIYAAYQIGTVKLRLEEFEEALKAFRELLKMSPNYVPALQGQGEAAFRWAEVLCQEQRLGCAKDCCQEAIDSFSKVLSQRKDLSCTWKLLGDTCLLGARLPTAYSSFHAVESVVSPNSTSDTQEKSSSVMLKKMDMFLAAERMYCRAMSINQDNSFLWHDLAAANFWHAMAVLQSSEQFKILQRAMTAARRAVSLCPENDSHWNMLGVVAACEEMKQRAIAQHAFIQAIQLNSNNAVAWTNLGTLYLMVGDPKLANKAFSAAQRCDHDYTRCWVGQAFVAESMLHSETMDLFRHAATLEYHSESCSGYAHWVLKTLLEKEKIIKTNASTQDIVLKDMKVMHALEVAADGMRWYTERHESDPCGWNMLGLLLERLTLFQSALKAFQRGLEEAVLIGSDALQLDAIRCNLGRVLTNQQDYESSIQVLKSVNHSSFASQSALALALYKAEKFEEAYEAYSTALEWLAPDEETKAHILMAMASMQYSFNQLEECKTLLFQTIHPKPLSAHPLLALCAVGLLHQDIAMSRIMLKELSRFKDDSRYLSHIGLLSAYTSFLQGDQKGAIRALAKAVHRHPGEGTLWLSLAHIQMHAYPKCDPLVIGHTAHAALLLGRANMDISKVQALVSVAQLLSSDGISAAKSSQKAVHQYPNVSENWSTLTAAILPLNKSPQRAAWLRDLIAHVRRRLQPSGGGLKKWLGNYEHHLTSLASG